MKTQIIKGLNNLLISPVPTELAVELADKIDALPCCNVTEVRHSFRMKKSSIVVADSEREKAIQEIKNILLSYTK